MVEADQRVAHAGIEKKCTRIINGARKYPIIGYCQKNNNMKYPVMQYDACTHDILLCLPPTIMGANKILSYTIYYAHAT